MNRDLFLTARLRRQNYSDLRKTSVFILFCVVTSVFAIEYFSLSPYYWIIPGVLTLLNVFSVYQNYSALLDLKKYKQVKDYILPRGTYDEIALEIENDLLDPSRHKNFGAVSGELIFTKQWLIHDNKTYFHFNHLEDIEWFYAKELKDSGNFTFYFGLKRPDVINITIGRTSTKTLAEHIEQVAKQAENVNKADLIFPAQPNQSGVALTTSHLIIDLDSSTPKAIHLTNIGWVYNGVVDIVKSGGGLYGQRFETHLRLKNNYRHILYCDTEEISKQLLAAIHEKAPWAQVGKMILDRSR
jgi:hypothetical protein